MATLERSLLLGEFVSDTVSQAINQKNVQHPKGKGGGQGQEPLKLRQQEGDSRKGKGSILRQASLITDFIRMVET